MKKQSKSEANSPGLRKKKSVGSIGQVEGSPKRAKNQNKPHPNNNVGTLKMQELDQESRGEEHALQDEH